MARTNEEIDKINKSREFGGLDPLPYEITDSAAQIADKERVAKELEEKEKSDKEIADKELADKEAAAKLEEDRIKAEKDKVEKNKPLAEATDEEIAQLLKGRGINVNNLDELKSKRSDADIAKETEQREANKVAYGLTNGLFSKKEYEAYNNDANDLEEVTFKDFAADELASDPNLKPEELKSMFEEKFFLNEPEGSAKRKRGEKEIGIIASKIIQTKHSKILSLDNAFDIHETEEKGRVAENNKILASAPVYKKDVEDVFSELKTISVPFSDTEVYEAELPAEVMDGLKNELLKTETATSRIKSGWDKKELSAQVRLAAIESSLPHLVKSISEKYLIAHAKGTHGIINNDGTSGAGGAAKKLPEAVQDELDRKQGTGKYA